MKDHTHQLPMGAGNCQWGGLTDRKQEEGGRRKDRRTKGQKARKYRLYKDKQPSHRLLMNAP